MQIKLKTNVKQDWKIVASKFDKDLLLKLNPPFPLVKILRFDGCQTNDIVSMELNFLILKSKWESLITFDTITNEKFEFVDEGRQMPSIFAKWSHRHIVASNDNGAKIIDHITYETPWKVLTYIMYPLLYLQFLYRKPVYKATFK